jgi:hypothetical protein
MKPYRYYSSPHVTEKVYLMDVYAVTPAGGKYWNYMDVTDEGASLVSGPLVLQEDWTIQKISREIKKELIRAWFKGMEKK